jgi:GT2 family glycosyltransferase
MSPTRPVMIGPANLSLEAAGECAAHAEKEKKDPLISIVIPHLNQLEALTHCLVSLDRQSLDATLFEIVIVDNGSASSPQSVVSRFAGAKLLHESAPGPGPARNCGVRATFGEILCFIDADCRAHPDWLSNGLRELSCAPAGTILGGDVQILHDQTKPMTGIEAYECIFSYRQQNYIERKGFSVMANLMLRRTDFEKIGPIGGIDLAEDLDWGYRARLAGIRYRYVPNMIVFHQARGSLREMRIKWDRHIQHAFKMAQNRPWWKIRWIGEAAAVFCSPAVSWSQIFTTTRIRGARCRLSALVILCRVRSYRAFKMLASFWSSAPLSWNERTTVLAAKRTE